MSTLDRVEDAFARCDALGVETTKIFLALDRARIRSDAAAIDERIAAGESMPLAGLLCSIKDLIDRSGERTTAGSVLLSEREVASEDAEIVTRLESAGAVVFGRTNQTEFAYSGLGLNPHHGTPGAIFDRKRVPGGSSSGAALSVAHDLCDVAIGTDTGGSVRIPAAVNGLYGFKPTASSVPLTGTHPLAPEMDSIGPLAPDLETLLRVAGTLRGRAFDAAGDDGRPLRLGLPGAPLTSELDDGVRKAFDKSVAALREAGIEIVDIDLEWLSETAPANRALVAFAAHTHYKDAYETLARIGDPDILRRMRFAETLGPDALVAAAELRERSIERFTDALDAARVTAILAPTLAVLPPTIAAAKKDFDTNNVAMLRNASMISFVDGCAISLPTKGHGKSTGKPFGALMLAAPRDHDDALVAAAMRVDSVGLR